MEEKNSSNTIVLHYDRSNNKLKQAWESSCEDSNGDYYYVNHEGIMMMAWPPRSYTCSFCKREFRSAQALGGHMNVHRRDRAHLRQLSLISSNSNPNYIFTNTTNNNNSHPLNLNLPPNPSGSIILSSQKHASFGIKKIKPSTSVVAIRPRATTVKTIVNKTQYESFKKQSNTQDITRLDGNLKKEGGMIRADDMEIDINVGVNKEDLDLELRLGHN